jgi:SRSO17 transposase
MTQDELKEAADRLRKFLKRYRKHLGRKEVQRLVETYVTGLLSDTRKKNAEAIAWEIGDGRVRALQRLLVSARWDEEAVVAEHQRVVAELLGSDDGILIVDDTGFRKKGVFSCGVGRQYSGSLGKTENCQVGVFLSYAAPGATHALLDRRLYLKKEWFRPEWAEHRERAHMPEGVLFRTKPELALEMIEGALMREIPHGWVNMDAGYGEVPAFLDALEELGERYVAQVPCNTHVWTEYPETYIPARKGKRGPHPKRARLKKGAPLSRTVAAVAAEMPQKAFKSAILRVGEKGPIHVEAAAVRVWSRRGNLPGREEWLLVVRRFGQKPETKYMLSNASAGTPLMTMVHVGLARWTEEQCFEQGKDDLGLGEYQTKTWLGWYRHATLVMLAHSFLIWLDIRGKKRRRASEPSAAARHHRAGA